MAGAGLRIANCILVVLLLCGWTSDRTVSPTVDFKAAQASTTNIAFLRRLLDQPEEKIDLVRAKVIIDRIRPEKLAINHRAQAINNAAPFNPGRVNNY